MKFRLIWISVSVMVTSVGTSNLTENSTTTLRGAILPYFSEISPSTQNDLDDTRKSGNCREVPLHKCGGSMVRVFRLLDFLPHKKSYESKCALRKAFFKCMKSEDGPCRKRRLGQSARFRKKLVRSLWSTRGCVLGADQFV